MWALFSRLSSGSFVCFQSTKSNRDITSRDQKQHRYGQKRTLSAFFQTKRNVETSTSFTLSFCRSDSPLHTPTTLLPPSDAPPDVVVPTATANRANEVIGTFYHRTPVRTPVPWKHQSPSLWNEGASQGLPVDPFTPAMATKSPQLDITCISGASGRPKQRRGTKLTTAWQKKLALQRQQQPQCQAARFL